MLFDSDKVRLWGWRMEKGQCLEMLARFAVVLNSDLQQGSMRCEGKTSDLHHQTRHRAGTAAYLSRATVWSSSNGRNDGSHAPPKHGAPNPSTFVFLVATGLTQATGGSVDLHVITILAAMTPHGADHRDMLILRFWQGNAFFPYHPRLANRRSSPVWKRIAYRRH